MQTLILSCPTLKKELLRALADAGAATPVHFMPQRLHSSPKELHEYVQTMIDSMANVERIVICASGCGGGTLGLKASTAELVLPKTRDCIDILLAGESLQNIYRPKHGIFMTESWAEFNKNSSLDLDKQIAAKGREEAEAWLKKIFKGFENFYIIDTGAYDTKPVEEYLTPLVNVLGGTLTKIKGEYGILRKIAAENFDDDFWIVPKGASLPMDAYKKPDCL